MNLSCQGLKLANSELSKLRMNFNSPTISLKYCYLTADKIVTKEARIVLPERKQYAREYECFAFNLSA